MIERDISDGKFHLLALDGLRGLAALIVVFSHTSNSGMYFLPYMNLHGIGKSGVFLFFLLSAFLLSRPLLEYSKSILSRSIVTHYGLRRFLRIYPLYIVYLMVALLSTWLLARGYSVNNVALPFTLNWSDVVGQLLLQDARGVTWSIAVEFKFYFILPILILIISFVLPLGFLLSSFLFLMLLVGSQIVSPQHDSHVNDARLLPYIPIFLFGVYLAVVQQYLQNSSALRVPRVQIILKCLGWLGVAGVVLMTPLFFSIVIAPVPKNYFHQEFILYAGFWSLILVSAINTQGYLNRFLCSSLLRFFGAVSFGVYLWHPIFIQILRVTELPSGVKAWLVLALATGFSYVTFRLIEKPASTYAIASAMRK